MRPPRSFVCNAFANLPWTLHEAGGPPRMKSKAKRLSVDLHVRGTAQ